MTLSLSFVPENTPEIDAIKAARILLAETPVVCFKR